MLKIKVIENSPHFRPRPKSIPRYFPFSNGSFDAFINEEEVLKRIARWARECRDAEIAGRLVGRVYRDRRGFWCVITGAIPADVTGGPVKVATTEKDAADTTRTLNELHPAEDLAGWYHSHLSGFDEYSLPDRVNQAQWGKPYHLGLLISLHPDRVKIHAFRGPASERLDESYVVLNRQLITGTLSSNLTATVPVPDVASSSPAAPKPAGWLCRIGWPLLLLAAICLTTDRNRRQWQSVADELRRLETATKQLQLHFAAMSQQQQSQHEEVGSTGRGMSTQRSKCPMVSLLSPSNVPR